MVLEVNLELYSTLGGRLTYEPDTFPLYSTILLSSVHKIFLHLLTGQSRCSFANSIRFRTCFDDNSETIRGLQALRLFSRNQLRTVSTHAII